MVQKVIWWLGIALLVLGPIWFFRSGLPFGHDVTAHVSRVKLMAEALKLGPWPVRWVDYAFDGDGAPLFNYYQPGFFYVAGGLTLLTGSVTVAVKLTAWILWALMVGGLFKLFGHKGRLTALIASLTYIFSVYILSDWWVRAAYPEAMALAIFPWTWFALEQKQWRLFALTIAGLALAHLPTLFLAGVFLMVFSGAKQFKRQEGLRFLGAGTVGMVMSAFYWLPALSEMPLIQNEWLSYGGYDFRAHFVTLQQLFTPHWSRGISRAGTDDTMTFFLGGIQILIILVSLWLVRWGKKFKREYFAALGLMVVAIGMMLPEAQVFWEGYPFLRFFQYPWRWTMVVVWVTTWLVGLVMDSLPKRGQWWLVGSILIISGWMWWLTKPVAYIGYNFEGVDEPWQVGERRWVEVDRGYRPRLKNGLTRQKTKIQSASEWLSFLGMAGWLYWLTSGTMKIKSRTWQQ